MATSNDHPGLPFVQAAGYTPGRPDGPPLWIVIHDMEAHELSNTAETTAAYFADPSDGRSVSAHKSCDNNSVVQCVDDDDVAWTVGNRPGNYRGLNYELAGFASQTRAQWLDSYGVAMFDVVAPLIRADCTRWGIPMRRCTIDDLLNRRKGITSHNDLRVAFGGTTHTDPGPNFPWDYFLAVLNGTTGDDMAQMLVRFGDDPVEPDQVWLVDGQFRRRVKPEWMAGTPTGGPIGNNQSHFSTNLGNLGNGGNVLVSSGDKDVWGIDIATLQGGGTGVSGPVELTDASVDKVAEAVADEAHNRLAE